MSVERRYYGWRARHQHSTDVPLDVFTDIYRLGGGDTLRASSKLAELVAELKQIIWWLEAEDEHERAIAWAESNANAEEHAIRAMDGELEDLPF